MLGRKKTEGRPLKETADMKIWREEFNQMKPEDHDRVLKNLGLDDEDVEEFKEAVSGKKKLEDILGVQEGEGTELEEAPEMPSAKPGASIAKAGMAAAKVESPAAKKGKKK